jgi:parallel beta-helix repeat protein
MIGMTHNYRGILGLVVFSLICLIAVTDVAHGQSSLVKEGKVVRQPWFPIAPALPQPTGQIMRVYDVKGLFRAVKEIGRGGTILVDDGTYILPRTLHIQTDGVTLRSTTGRRDKVIFDGSDCIHGELVAFTKCSDVMVADLTIANIKWNGFKINSDKYAQRITIYNCVIHNIWQRGVKAPHVPANKQKELSPRECRVQYCLFYNDRKKEFSDDQADQRHPYNGNYIGGIDVKNTLNWTISDNVFIGIQGRTREGRGAIYISENGRGALIERNVFVDCDIAIAIGNPTLGYSPSQAIGCIVRNNFVSNCPETGILACHTLNCKIINNTIHNPDSKMKRLIFVQKNNEGLVVVNNLLSGPPIRITSPSKMRFARNVVHDDLSAWFVNAKLGDLRLRVRDDKIVDLGLRTGVVLRDMDNQVRDDKPDIGADEFSLVPPYAVRLAKAGSTKVYRGVLINGVPLEMEDEEADEKLEGDERWIKAMLKVRKHFHGQPNYVAQIGDSITHASGFWLPIKFADPALLLGDVDKELPKYPFGGPWSKTILGFEAKGSNHCNYPGWQCGHLLRNIDWLVKRDKPEVAIVMIGTNGINGGVLSDQYVTKVEDVLRRIMRTGCVPILNTIPPRRDRGEVVSECNDVIRGIAKRLRVPLVDYYAECLKLRPGLTWDNTLISKDGIHPTAGNNMDWSKKNRMVNGYAVRTWENFKMYRKVYFNVLHPDWKERKSEIFVPLSTVPVNATEKKAGTADAKVSAKPSEKADSKAGAKANVIETDAQKNISANAKAEIKTKKAGLKDAGAAAKSIETTTAVCP